MVSGSVEIRNEQGLHMRLAGIFASEMSKYKSRIILCVDGKRVNGKSIMHIIASCIGAGTSITIECSGEDEQEALSAAISYIESGFGEN